MSCHITPYTLTIKASNYPSTLDDTLIGAWVGGHLQKDGTNKRWRQIRNSDGSYVIFFGYSNENNASYETSESGRWWIKNGKYHEINPSRMSKPDIYRYELYNDKCLKFTQLSRDDSGDEYEGYSFTECRSKKTIFTKWLYERV